ncbi:Membrane-bound lytic murein transglycosylase F [Pontiella desulfatans]|uniref:Membrane-bound lytic murein transglycosylase F n=1 Tax=Pontiella desulfatans TaxID=2750659 RepID=A0A6C2U707_PONDE|nr:transporter substrate-binding domain-containing protein [Pontiella desulfatans]VGO15166.1 Membrane-bound lytic murein transglycosylase F [Pontiella desulfatans]
MTKLLMAAVILLGASAHADLEALPRGLEEANKKGVQLDLEALKERGFIRVLTRNNPACYFMHRGQLMGFEYELAQHFAKKHGLEVLVIVPDNWSDMGQYLRDGRADMIAATVTITKERFERKSDLQFCHYYGEFYEDIVGRADDRSIKSVEDLKGRSIYVRASSSYYESLVNLQDQSKVRFKIKLVPESMETFEILDKVASGEFDLTCADRTLLNQSVRLGERLKPILKLNRPRTYGWVVRDNQPQLRAAVDAYFEKELGGSTFNTIYNRYFNLSRNTTLDDKFNTMEPGQISPYDDLVKKHAATYEFPWTLICSQMFQESSFREDAVSWSGAQGLMQLMPATAKEVGVKNPFDPDDNIRGGTYYLKKQYRRVPDEVDTVNTTCFALASYNGGYGHLIDARKLAKQLGKDPNVWTDNVDHAYALLSEPYYSKRAKYGYCRSEEIIGYVRKIMSRYIAYDAAINTSIAP